jgi:molybdopterin molybdotransferase
MLTPAEAAAAIAAELRPLGAEPCRLEHAAGRVLREDLAAERDQPPFDRVAMDGIAIDSKAYASGVRSFRIAGTIAAGTRPVALGDPHACLEVMTGAVLPPGADAVVPVELLEVVAGTATVRDAGLVPAWSNIHRRGIDAPAGSRSLAAGTRLRGPELAIAASIGRGTLSVGLQPRIAVISTGDELIGPDQPIEAWQIRRSNAYGVNAVLALHGYGRLTDDHVPDVQDTIRRTLGEHLADHDVLILSGGVSAGKFDFIPTVLAELGVRRVFHKVAQRPGKPFWFGMGPAGQAVFALPGNPVSTIVCLVRYVLPALAQLSGATAAPIALAPLAVGFEAKHGLTAFLPVDPVTDGPRRGSFALHPTQGSGDFTSLRGTAGFVELAPGHPHAPGNPVPFYTW